MKMRKNKTGSALILSLIAILLCVWLVSCGTTGSKEASTDSGASANDDGGIVHQLNSSYDSYTNAIDTKFAYDLAVEITEGEKYNNNAEFGDRTAGSDAEHATADRLAEVMSDIGLADVEKIGTSVDKWQFNGASLKVDGMEDILLHSYATAATQKDGIDAEIVYVGKGTKADYEGLDVKGKIVLFDVDQRADWWVTYPMLEAEHQGAVAALACSNKGFSEVNEEAYNANDICGPTSIPTVSITVKDSKALRDRIKKGKVKGLLKVDNMVEPNGTTYNVMGKIKGKDSEHVMLYGAHYDAHFRGFQDDTIAATGVLAIAKAYIDSGYEPEHDIWFVLHGAEEWGATSSSYDWCTGAWRLINEAHPEWQGKILTFFNFELPAYEFADYTYTTSDPEQYEMIRKFTEDAGIVAPKPEGVFKDGIKLDGYQTYTYSDDFSYYVAGVPSIINGFLLTADGEDAFPFYYNYYHTNFDTKDTYNENVFKFNLEYYGAMGIHVDSTPALELDFRPDAQRLKESLNEDTAKAAGADYDQYMKAVADYSSAADELWKSVESLNSSYKKALESGDTAAAGELWTDGKDLTKKNLDIFAETQKAIVSLMYERPIVPHEAAQENIELIGETVKALKAGKIAEAADEYAWKINNVEEWYTMYFSKEVADTGYDVLYDSNNEGKLFWGTGRQFLWADVDDAVRGMMAKYDKSGADVSKEIKIFEKAAKEQQTSLVKIVGEEKTKILSLADRMSAAKNMPLRSGNADQSAESQ